MDHPAKIAVSGATGVVGTAVLAQVRQAYPAAKISLLVRTAHSAYRLSGPHTQTVIGDLDNLGALSHWVEGADLVFHIAGLNQMCLRDPSPLYRVNVDGTRNVLRAAGEMGVARMVYTSSAATIGEEKGEVGEEMTPHRGWYRSHYERSKHLAEQVVGLESRSYPDTAVVTVNPSSVQGPGRVSGTGKILLAVLEQRLRWLVDVWVSLVDIDDCAQGHIQAAKLGKPGERYLLNSFTLRLNGVEELLQTVTGRPYRLQMIPARLVKMLGVISELGGRWSTKPPLLCREMANTLLAGHRFDGSKAATDLQINYSSAGQTLSRMWHWYQNADQGG